MSSKVDSLAKVLPNDEDDKSAERSRSGIQKIVAVDRKSNEDSQAPGNSFDETIDVKLRNIRNRMT